MNRRPTKVNRIRRGAVAVALLAVVIGAAPPTAAMAAEPAPAGEDGEFTTQIAQGFGVRNLTTSAMISRGVEAAFTSSAPRFDNDHPAPPGEVIDPALEDYFTMTYWFLSPNGALINYQVGDLGSVTVKATVDGFTAAPSLSCFAVTGALLCDVSGESAFIRSSSATQSVLEASQQQEQADALKKLCDVDSPHVSCSFDPKGEIIESLAKPHPLTGTNNRNFNCKSQTLSRYSFTWGLEQATSWSVGGSVTIGGTIKKVVEVSVTTEFSHTWGWTKVTQESHAADIAPGYWTWVEQRPARLTVTGDFTAVIGNDTMVIRDVSFEAPDKRELMTGAIGSLEEIMSPADRVEYCHESPEVAQRRYDLVLAASPDGAASAPGAGDPAEPAAADTTAAEAPAFTEPDEIAEFEAAFEAAG